MRVLLVLTAALTAASVAGAGGPSRPRLFLTQERIEEVRVSIERGEPFRGWATELVERALSERIGDLPELERSWWTKDRERPWAETYPQIFHHTWIVPARWAGLARRCARASLVSEGETAAALSEKARLVLLRLADYTYEFTHYDVGMNYTVWTVQALEAYDILWKELTPDDRIRLDAFFARFLEAVFENDRYWVEHEPGGPLNNHYAWHKLGVAAYGLFYDRPELVREALSGAKGIDSLLEHGFTDDGLWLESAIPYQFAATAPLVILAELLENAGSSHGLWSRDTGDGRTLKQAYDALLPLLLPDRTLPTVGDCYGRRAHLGQRPDWEILSRRFREPGYSWLLRDLEERGREALFTGALELPPSTPPELASRLWPEHGYAALRSVEGLDYWTGRGWTLFATFSTNPVHAHADRLSIQLFAEGHLWLPDLEALPSAEHAFSATIQRELNRSTLCHNTLLVDGKSQRAPDGRLDLVEYHGLERVKRLSVGDLAGRLYPGVRQLRTCIVRKEYVLDVFQVRAEEARELAWLLHVDGVPERRGGREEEPLELPRSAPWSFVRDARRHDVEREYRETFRHGGMRFIAQVGMDGPGDVVYCALPRDDGPAAKTIPMRLLRRRGRVATFVALYRVAREPIAPAVVEVREGPLESLTVTVGRGGSSTRHRIPRLSP